MLVSNNGSALDLGKWGIYNDPNGKHPRVPSAVSVGAGEMRITGGVDATGKDVSGGIAARLNQLYGRWEARFRVDRGAGYSAVVLLWPKGDHWPTDGEINLAEVNRGSRASALNYLHNKPWDYKRGNTMHADFTQWHTVAVDWSPGRATFYLDGVVQWDVTDAELVPSTAPMHMALQFDKGCDSFIECRNYQTPDRVSMRVDWVRTYVAV